MDSKELMELIERRNELDPYYTEKEARASEPGELYDWLFWFTIVGVLVCASLLAISWILELLGI